MIDDVLRMPKEKIMAPLAKALPGVSPTAITVAACLVGVASGAAAAGQQYGPAIGLWGVNRLLDGLDGSLARMNGKQKVAAFFMRETLSNLKSEIGAYLRYRFARP